MYESVNERNEALKIKGESFRYRYSTLI
jgi:hypothetical protein